MAGPGTRDAICGAPCGRYGIQTVAILRRRKPARRIVVIRYCRHPEDRAENRDAGIGYVEPTDPRLPSKPASNVFRLLGQNAIPVMQRGRAVEKLQPDATDARRRNARDRIPRSSISGPAAAPTPTTGFAGSGKKGFETRSTEGVVTVTAERRETCTGSHKRRQE